MKRFSVILATMAMIFISVNVYAGEYDFDLAGMSTNYTENVENTENSAAALSCEKPLWGFIDHVGFSYTYGKDQMLPDAWRGDHALNTVLRWSVYAESRNLLLPEEWGIQLKFSYSDHKGDEIPDHGQDAGFKELGITLAIKRYFFDDMFYVGLLAGLSYVDEFPNFENRDWPDKSLESNLGRSHYLGSWGGMFGRNWHIYEAWYLKTEVELTHTSDPFRADMGKNFLAATFGVSYNF